MCVDDLLNLFLNLLEVVHVRLDGMTIIAIVLTIK